MYNSILLSIKQEQFTRYSQAFNFFQSKSINMIIGSRKIDYVVHYRDLQILDDETQYFKRYYSMKQTATRVLKLINYYELNMTPPTPNLILINTFNILETRKRKQIKLVIMKEKSQAKRAEAPEEEQYNSAHMILEQMDQSNFSDLTSEKEDNSDHQSYDSDPHCAYDLNEQDLRQTGYGRSKSIVDIFSFKQLIESDVILDFKAASEEPPKINVIPPAPQQILPPPPPPVETVSIAIQTTSIEFVSPKKYQKEVQAIKPVQIPQLKKQVITPISQMGLRSELKKQNVILTDSIEMLHKKEQKEKPKGNTFMDYYNSQPAKAPSNILEKFIKRKK